MVAADTVMVEPPTSLTCRGAPLLVRIAAQAVRRKARCRRRKESRAGQAHVSIWKERWKDGGRQVSRLRAGQQQQLACPIRGGPIMIAYGVWRLCAHCGSASSSSPSISAAMCCLLLVKQSPPAPIGSSAGSPR